MPFSFPESIRRLEQTGLFSPIDLHLASFVCRLDHKEAPVLALSVALLSRHVGQGHICLDTGRLDPLCVNVLHAHDIAVPPAPAWQHQLMTVSVVGGPGAACPLILDGSRLYMKRYFDYETTVADHLSRLASDRASGKLTDSDRRCLRKGLASYFPDTAEGGFWQKVAGFAAVTRRLCVISGGPGTGKTTTVAKILALILEQEEKPCRIVLAAPTGKAAARLGESLQGMGDKLHLPDNLASHMPTSAATLQRLLGWIPDSPVFRHNENNPLDLDILVLDEVSMVDLPLMAKTLQALPQHARLILLGDKDQLASVEAGAVLGDICGRKALNVFSPAFVQEYVTTVGTWDTPSQNLPEQLPEQTPHQARGSGLLDSVVSLTKSYRFGEESGIKRLSLAIRDGEGAKALAILEAQLPDIAWIPIRSSDDPSSVLSSIIQQGFVPAFATDDVGERYQRLQTFRILSPLRDGLWGTANLNALVRKTLETQGCMERTSLWPQGLLVMVSVNEYGVRLYNGDVGLVASSEEGRPRVYFPDMEHGGMRSLAPVRLPPHEPAFAMTVHKSQGSEFDHVVFVLPEADSPLLSRELVYTAITRARNKVTLVGHGASFVRAVGRRIQRSSGLGERLERMRGG